MTPEEAVVVRLKVAKKITVMVKQYTTTQIERFVYHCPYCKGIDSPYCAYINYPLTWKIEHSTRKPWNEDVITSVDVAVKREVIEEIEVL